MPSALVRKVYEDASIVSFNDHAAVHCGRGPAPIERAECKLSRAQPVRGRRKELQGVCCSKNAMMRRAASVKNEFLLGDHKEVTHSTVWGTRTHTGRDREKRPHKVACTQPTPSARSRRVKAPGRRSSGSRSAGR